MNGKAPTNISKKPPPFQNDVASATAVIACNACTFSNVAGALVCEMCRLTLEPKTSNVAAVAALPETTLTTDATSLQYGFANAKDDQTPPSEKAGTKTTGLFDGDIGETTFDDQKPPFEKAGTKTTGLVDKGGIDAMVEAMDALLQEAQEDDADLAAALALQEKLTADAATLERDREHEAMLSTHQGRAWKLIETVLDIYPQLFLDAEAANMSSYIETVAVDDMVYSAERFIKCYDTFLEQGKCAQVEFAYHYTKPENLHSIRQDGLMSGSERAQKGIRAKRVEAFGPGIYAATNPFAFLGRYGNVGLLVAIIKGHTKRIHDTSGEDDWDAVDTVIGNKYRTAEKMRAPPFYDEIVLTQSCQCLPLIKFSSEMLSQTADHTAANLTMWRIHDALQTVMDNFFHAGNETIRCRILPSDKPTAIVAAKLPTTGHPFRNRSTAPPPAAIQVAPTVQSHQITWQPPTFTGNASAQAPSALPSAAYPPISTTAARPFIQILQPTGYIPPAPGLQPKLNANPKQPFGAAMVPGAATSSYEILQYHAPLSLVKDNLFERVVQDCVTRPASSASDECPICMETLSSGVAVFIRHCKHEFHRECAQQALKMKPSCPVCRKCLSEPQGKGPSGKMTLEIDKSFSCQGFWDVGTIVVKFNMPSGVQRPYHQNPGHSYSGTKRTVYLPNNPDGQALLRRLKYAWMRGLMFAIGTSMTTGRTNQITWASVHLKTSTSGGPQSHGFPDPFFFANCNGELDALEVPPAEQCPSQPVRNDPRYASY